MTSYATAPLDLRLDSSKEDSRGWGQFQMRLILANAFGVFYWRIPMKKPLSLIVVFTFLASAPNAFAAGEQLAGDSLVPVDAGSLGVLNYGQFGINNTSQSFVVSVAGSIPNVNLGLFNRVKATVYNRHSALRTNCNVQVTSRDGAFVIFSGNIMALPATAGPQTLTTPPFTVTGNAVTHIQCAIATFQPGGVSGGMSHIASIFTE
ncbi:MAG TPA: hypothetical protein VGF45_21340 [Polyangia bacterium]